MPFLWMRGQTYVEMSKIQNTCKKALKVWGYKLIESEQEYYTRNVLEDIAFSI